MIRKMHALVIESKVKGTGFAVKGLSYFISFSVGIRGFNARTS